MSFKKEESRKVYENELALSPFLVALNLSFERKLNYIGFDLQFAFLEKKWTCSLGRQVISSQAVDILQSVLVQSAYEKDKYSQLMKSLTGSKIKS